jgi:hypothetical protein
MPLVYTYALGISQPCPWRRGRARRRRTMAEVGKHAAWECDWAHHASIGGGGLDGDDPGKWRWRGRGGAPTAVRVPVKLEAGEINAQPWELKGDLGKARRVWPAVGASRAWAHRRRQQWRIGGRRTHAREEREAAFYSRVRAQASLLRSEATDALRHGVRRPSACMRGGRMDGTAASARTPRGARAHQPRRVL